MKIAVTDACIFIDLIDLGLLNEFFSLKMEIHTTIEVVNELYADQQKELFYFTDQKRLWIHNLSESQKSEIRGRNYSNALSEADKSALFIASVLKAILISSDNLVRKTAKGKNIRCHGILWILDQLVGTQILAPKNAAAKLQHLSQSNKMFNNNYKLEEEINSRLSKWKDTLG